LKTKEIMGVFPTLPLKKGTINAFYNATKFMIEEASIQDSTMYGTRFHTF